MQVSTYINSINYNTSDKTESKTAQKTSQKTSQAQAALTLLSSNKASDSIKEAKKSFARQRLDQIKQKIKILQNMYAANPEKLAKILASLVKELKQIVKSYGSAIGGSSQLVTYGTSGTLSTGDTTSETDLTEDVSTTDVSATETGSGQVAANNNEAESDSDAATVNNMEDDNNSSSNTTSSTSSDDDRNFIKDVRDLLKKIKAAYKLAQSQIEFESNYKSKDDVEKSEDAFRKYKSAEQSLAAEINSFETKISGNSLTLDTGNSASLISVGALIAINV